MPENDHHLPLLQCASTVIIWIGFFYGNSFQYERHKFLKHIIMNAIFFLNVMFYYGRVWSNFHIWKIPIWGQFTKQILGPR